MRSLRWLRDSVGAFDRVFFGGAAAAQGVAIRWMPWRPLKQNFIFGLCWLPDVTEGRDRATIEVNRVLAHAWVPEPVVLLTVYHELLHVFLGPEHDLAFRLSESRFPHYADALVWEEANIDKLIAAPRPWKQ